MPSTPRSRLVSHVGGAALMAGLGMIPLHRLPRPVQQTYVFGPAAATTGLLLLAFQRNDGADSSEDVASGTAVRGGPRLPTAKETALALAFGGLVAGVGAGGIRLDRGIEDFLRRRGVAAPRVWMGLAGGALSLTMDLVQERLPDPDQVEEREELEDRVLELLSDADPMDLTPGRAGGTPADEYQGEAQEIAEILRTEGTITAARLDEVWEHWFFEPLSPLLGDGEISSLASALRALVPAQDVPDRDVGV